MKTPVHQIQIVNKDSVWFTITNIGDRQNSALGIESIVINRTKDDINEECVITLVSKFDVNGAQEIDDGSRDLRLTNQLPTDQERIFDKEDFRQRFGHFDYAIGDMVMVKFAYNEETRGLAESYFGFIKSATSTNGKKVVITLQNHTYLLKKILYNFSQKDLKVQNLFGKLLFDYNKRFNEIYRDIINGVFKRGNVELAKELSLFGSVSFVISEGANELINVDYTDPKFRAENVSSLDILIYLREKYFTKSIFFQVPNEKTFFIAGFLNLLQLSLGKNVPPEIKGTEADATLSLRKFLEYNFVFKNYDLIYETYGLNDNFILSEIREQGNELKEENAIIQNILNKSLTWQEAKDVIVRINFKTVDRNNEVTKDVAFGDNAGETKTVTYYEEKTDEQLKKLGEEYIGDLKYTGYKRGSSITTFGNPSVSIFDEIYIIEVFQNQSIKSNTVPYKLVIQKYLVDSVNINYSNSGGLRQTITFGALLSTNIKVETGKDNNIVFKAETQRFTKTSTGKSTEDGNPETFVDNATDYQLLNQIDTNNDNIEGHSDELFDLFDEWIEKTELLKGLRSTSISPDITIGGTTIQAPTSPEGYYTRTFGETKPEFTSVALLESPDVLLSNTTIKTRRDLRIRIEKIFELVVSRQSSLETSFKLQRKDISAAKTRGLDVTEREQTFKDISARGIQAGIKAQEIRIFDNEK